MLICLLGPTCAGKDTILHEIFNGERQVCISLSTPSKHIILNRLPIYTTRPRRNNEEDDVYYFVDDSDHSPKPIDVNGCSWDYTTDKTLESRQYITADGHVWEYGTLPAYIQRDRNGMMLYDISDNDYIVACSMMQLQSYVNAFNNKLISVIYIPVEPKIQYKRYFNRLVDNDQQCIAGNISEMFRRIKADELDFSDINSIKEKPLYCFTEIQNATTIDVICELFKILVFSK